MERQRHTHDFEPIPETLKEAIQIGRQLQIKGDWKGSELFFTNCLIEIEASKFPGVTEQDIKRHILNERGVALRMQNSPDPNEYNEAYTRAEADFTEALDLSLKSNDPDSTLLALGGLIDLARTGDRGGVAYKRGKDLNQAKAWKKEAQAIMDALPTDQLRLSRGAALIQFGLLEHEQGKFIQALDTFNQAEQEFLKLIALNPDDNYLRNRINRTISVRAVTLENLNLPKQAFEDQSQAWNSYIGLDYDMRGLGNAATHLARLALAGGRYEDTRLWCQKAIEVSQKDDGDQKIVVDQTIYDIAIQILQELDTK